MPTLEVKYFSFFREPGSLLKLMHLVSFLLLYILMWYTVLNLRFWTDRQALTNSIDPDQGLHCLQLMDNFLYEKTSLFQLDCIKHFGSLKIQDFTINPFR